VKAFQYILRRKYILVVFCQYKVVTQGTKLCSYDSIRLFQCGYHLMPLCFTKVFFHMYNNFNGVRCITSFVLY